MNRSFRKRAIQAAVSLALLGGLNTSYAVVNVQCPGDLNGDGDGRTWTGTRKWPTRAKRSRPTPSACT